MDTSNDSNKIEPDALRCDLCGVSVHFPNLKSVPEGGMLAGDVFFTFSCENCNSTGREILTRRKLQWVMVVVITLHNLPKLSVSNQGYFHFRSHIMSFVEKHWTNFFPNTARRKRRNVLGTIAGVLSQHSPETFLSGTDEIGSIGWWKLTRNQPPVEIEKLLKNRPKRCLDTGDEGFLKRIKIEEDTETVVIKTEVEDNYELNVDEVTEMPERVKHELPALDENSENELHLQLDLDSDVDDHPWIQECYRKLHVKLKTDPDNPANELNDSLLGRYCNAPGNFQRYLLASPSALHCFQSPYTKNLLQPFIYRDKKMSPRWLKLMCELKQKVLSDIPERSSIDFCFASAHHISAINSLLQELFWPGVDMSEALSYPDFTVVALYKKLVVGCAFLVPDAGRNEAYISFLAVRPGWDRAGIASFMLYHLTQTSHGKDMTLHVSASNPAVCLYQKFGFKTQELALNFYEKFLPPDSPHSSHALYLRLTR